MDSKESLYPKVKRSLTAHIMQSIMVRGPSGKDRFSIEALPTAGAEHISGLLLLMLSPKTSTAVLPVLKASSPLALVRIAAPSSKKA